MNSLPSKYSNVMCKLMRTVTIVLFSLLAFYSHSQIRSMDSVTKVLEEVLRTDQVPRVALDSIAKKYGYDSEEMRTHWKKIHTSDSINLSTVSAIIDKYGWLSAKETSKKANDVLFLVIQHSDLGSQLKYLPYLQSAVKSGKAGAQDYAYLVDRIRTNQGKFQIYGTQFQSGADGKMFVYPIEDEPNVNKRRKKVGLDSLEVYARRADVTYTVPNKDTYKNKIVVYGTLTDKEQKPLADAEVYLGNDQLLAKTDKNGDYIVVINKRQITKGLTFQKDGYRISTFPLNEQKEVYTFVFMLDKK